MATRENFKLSIEQRRSRYFTASFKREKVQELESGLVTSAELQREYEVSLTSIQRWKRKYGTMKKEKTTRLIVEHKSDTHKLIAQKKKIAELERIIGQKQVLLDFQDKMIDLAEEHYKVEIKKKFSTQQPSSTGKTEK